MQPKRSVSSKDKMIVKYSKYLNLLLLVPLHVYEVLFIYHLPSYGWSTSWTVV